jgi:hypothetical protein
MGIGSVRVTRDAKGIAYTLDRTLSEVYIAKGLR